jgi:hypothetical protein
MDKVVFHYDARIKCILEYRRPNLHKHFGGSCSEICQVDFLIVGFDS